MSQIEQQFKNAVMALQSGQPLQAKRILEKLSKKVKDSSAIWYNLGLANQFLEKHSSAIPCYEKVVALKPDFEDARINLAISLKELGQIEAAKGQLAKISISHNARALNLQGTLTAQQGDIQGAQVLFEQAFELQKDNPEIRFNLANNLRQLEQYQKAYEYLQPLINEQASTSQLCLHGELLLDLKRYAEASTIIKQLVERYPKERDVQKLHLQMYEIAKSAEDIIRVAKQLLSEDERDASVWNALAGGYFQVDNMQGALQAYERAIALMPDNAEYWSNVGLVHAALGDKAQAEKCYRHSLDLRPRHPEPYRSLVAMKRYSDVQDEDIQVMQSMWQDTQLEQGYRMKLAFALGKAYDDCGLYDEAFAVYDEGNRLKFAEINTDFEQFFTHIDTIAQVYDKAPTQVSDATYDIAPIFIVGMPRSGTTLSEQIIARHPDVTGCGELPCIEFSIGAIEQDQGAVFSYPKDFVTLGVDKLNEKSAAMIDYVTRHYSVNTPYFIDKMPTNFMHVGFIKSLFPKAKIVNCRRHPLDVILSNYFQIFGSDLNFVYNLETLAKYYICYHALSRHWQGLFADDFYQNDYEALVTNHEAEAKKLITALDLPWDAACIDSDKALKQVRTASIWQVREGIYTRSKQRWKNYESQLAPAIAILQASGILDAQNNPNY